MPGRPLTRQSQQILESLNTTPEWWEGSLDRIACGDNPKDVAEEHLILFGVFMRWVEASDKRAAEYNAALKIASEGHAHDCLAIADEQKESVRKDGSTYDPDVARDKLRIETRLKLAGKWDRTRYGDQTTHVIDDRRGGGSEAEIRAQLAEILQRNPDVRRQLLTLDGDYERVIESLPNQSVSSPTGEGTVAAQVPPPPARAAVPDEVAAASAALRAEQSDRQVAASVYAEPGLAPRKSRGRRAAPVPLEDRRL